MAFSLIETGQMSQYDDRIIDQVEFEINHRRLDYDEDEGFQSDEVRIVKRKKPKAQTAATFVFGFLQLLTTCF